MSVFEGHLKEYTFISIDRFDTKNLQSTAYFLSHCHKDHIEGILDREFHDRLRNGRDLTLEYAQKLLLKLFKCTYDDSMAAINNGNVKLYTSETTRNLMVCDDDFKHLLPYVIGLPVHQPNLIAVLNEEKKKEENLTVHLISAGHCVGSVMFLIEGSEGTILYTGDFRLSSKELRKAECLHSGNNVRCLKSVYVDTTFLTPNIPDIPSRETTKQCIIEVIESWLSKGANYVVHLKCKGKYGYEYIMKQVAMHFKTKSTDSTYNLPCKLTHLDGVGVNMVTIVPSSLYFMKTGLPSDNKKYVLKQNLWRVFHSMHASYNEIRDFIGYLRPENVYPFVPPVDCQDVNEAFRRLQDLQREIDDNRSNVRLITDFSSDAGNSNWKENLRKQNINSSADKRHEEMLFGVDFDNSPNLLPSPPPRKRKRKCQKKETETTKTEDVTSKDMTSEEIFSNEKTTEELLSEAFGESQLSDEKEETSNKLKNVVCEKNETELKNKNIVFNDSQRDELLKNENTCNDNKRIAPKNENRSENNRNNKLLQNEVITEKNFETRKNENVSSSKPSQRAKEFTPEINWFDSTESGATNRNDLILPKPAKRVGSVASVCEVASAKRSKLSPYKIEMFEGLESIISNKTSTFTRIMRLNDSSGACVSGNTSGDNKEFSLLDIYKNFVSAKSAVKPQKLQTTSADRDKTSRSSRPVGFKTPSRLDRPVKPNKSDLKTTPTGKTTSSPNTPSDPDPTSPELCSSPDLFEEKPHQECEPQISSLTQKRRTVLFDSRYNLESALDGREKVTQYLKMDGEVEMSSRGGLLPSGDGESTGEKGFPYSNTNCVNTNQKQERFAKTYSECTQKTAEIEEKLEENSNKHVENELDSSRDSSVVELKQDVRLERVRLEENDVVVSSLENRSHVIEIFSDAVTESDRTLSDYFSSTNNSQHL